MPLIDGYITVESSAPDYDPVDFIFVAVDVYCLYIFSKFRNGHLISIFVAERLQFVCTSYQNLKTLEWLPDNFFFSDWRCGNNVEGANSLLN